MKRSPLTRRIGDDFPELMPAGKRRRRSPSNKRSRVASRRSGYQTQRKRVAERSDGRCERCGVAMNNVEGSPQQFHCHHRKLRAQGGRDELTNLAGICSDCHTHVHDHPAEAQETGWIVPSWGDPAAVPIRPLNGAAVLLTDDGRYEPYKAGEAA